MNLIKQLETLKEHIDQVEDEKLAMEMTKVITKMIYWDSNRLETLEKLVDGLSQFKLEITSMRHDLESTRRERDTAWEILHNNEEN